MFAEYFYALTPAALFWGFIVLISSPFLAMVAFLLLVAGTVAVLFWLLRWVLRGTGRAIAGRVDERHTRQRLVAPTHEARPSYAYAPVRRLDPAAVPTGRSTGSLSTGSYPDASAPDTLVEGRVR